MSKARPGNLPASVKQRLLNLSVQRGEDPNLVLTRYALERLLYRLARTRHREHFILKGAMLYAVWFPRPHRPTRDLDLLGHGAATPERLSDVFRQICGADVEPDGLKFDAGSVRVSEIRETQEYQSHRVKLMAFLGNARIPVQIDIGFGDMVTPEAGEIEYPTLLDLPAPRIRAYPPETVVAEKLHAMVVLGMANSRMKDFHDLWAIAGKFSFDGPLLVDAIRATFDRRDTRIPDTTPIAITDEFAGDRDKVTQWRAFLKRNRLEDAKVELSRVIETLRAFLAPPLHAAGRGDAFKQSWPGGGPWS